MTLSRILFGSLALAAYLVLFSAGMMLDSKPYRDELVKWTPRLDLETLHPINGAAAFESVAVAQTEEREGAPPNDAAPLRPAGLRLVPLAAFAGTFVSAMCLFTPINVALLALLAAFLGGCASNITYNRQGDSGLTERQAAFRSENPAASMIRGFLIYLGFVAGIYVATNSPFANVTADQYARLAGTVSFLAFVVGYDPTKFQDFISKNSGLPSKP
jgi:S1-C subfamily serine protease